MRQLQGGKRLLEMISLAGGLAPDAGQKIFITRRQAFGTLPLEGARRDETSGLTTGEISVTSLIESRDPQLNIPIMPHDVIAVERARMVYVMGEVSKPGGFVLSERESMSVLQALSLAGGLTHTAAPGSSRILRSVPGSSERQDTALNLGKVLSGKAGDVPLHPEDILFVPNSAARSATLRALEAGIQVGTGVAIWRR